MLVSIPAKELLAAAKIVNPYDARLALSCVQVIVTEHGYEIKSTDSYKALVFSGDVDGYHEEGSALLHAADLKGNLKASDHIVNLEVSDGKAVLIPKNKKGAVRCHVQIDAVECNYPKMDQLFEGEPAKDRGYSAAFNPGYLVEIMGAIGKAYGTHAKLELRGENKPCLITANGPKPGQRCKAIVMPVRVK